MIPMRDILGARDGPDRIYRAVLIACLAFHVLQLVALPLVMSPDGLDYVALSRRFGAGRFFESWPFVRMPLYPLMLRGSFEVFGTRPMAALLPGVLVGFVGVWALAAEVRRSSGALSGGAILVLLTGYPALVGYEHTVLTESGTFCTLSLLVVLLSRLARVGIDLATMCLLGTVLAVGYLFRATTLAALPGVILAVVVVCWRSVDRTPRARWRRSAVMAAAGLLVVMGLPFTTMTWWSARGRDARVGSAFGYTLVYYMAAQGVLPRESRPLGDATAEYEAAKLSTVGEWTALVPILPSVARQLPGAESGRLFRDLIVDRPRAYFAAVFRTVLVFLGVPPHHSENTLFVSNVLSLSVPGSKCVCPEEDQGAFANTFARTGQRTPIHYLLKIVTPAYVPLVMIGSGFTLFAFAVGARRGDPALLALTAVPVAFAAAHAMLLLGTDRFAMPVFPLALVNLVVFLPAFVQSIRSSRARRSVIPISGRAEERASSRCGPHSGLVPPTA